MRFIICFLLYVGIYIVLSANGGYRFSQSGKIRYKYELGGMTMSDIDIWCPKWCWFQTYTNAQGRKTIRGNPLGLLFSPLIMIDHMFVHETVELFHNKGEMSQRILEGLAE